MGCFSSKESSPGGIRIDTGSASAPHRTKLVVCGDRATGKSSLVTRYVKGFFSDNPASTIGAAFSTKDVILSDSSTIRLQIWDTAGEEAYRAMTKSFFRDALVGLIVYDVTNPNSFNSIGGWLQEFRDSCPDSIAVLVGNKIDRTESIRVRSGDAREFARGHGMLFFEISAKAGTGVDELFLAVCEELHKSRKNRTGPFA